MKILFLTLFLFFSTGCPTEKEYISNIRSESCSFTITTLNVGGEEITFSCECNKAEYITEYPDAPPLSASCSCPEKSSAQSKIEEIHECESLCEKHGLTSPMKDELTETCLNGDHLKHVATKDD